MMKKFMNRFGVLGCLMIVVFISGCILSATFIVEKIIYFTAHNDFYYANVDLTDDDVWQDHEDEIDFVDAIGIEFYITSLAPGNVTFDAYIDDYTTFGADPSEVPTGAIKIIDGFTISPGVGGMSYVASLNEIRELDTLKYYGKLGKFDLYVTTSGTVGTTFIVDSARAVVTISASE